MGSESPRTLRGDAAAGPPAHGVKPTSPLTEEIAQWRAPLCGRGHSRVLRTRFPLPGADEAHPASRGFEPLFMLDLMAKDIALALGLTDDAPVATAALA